MAFYSHCSGWTCFLVWDQFVFNAGSLDYATKIKHLYELNGNIHLLLSTTLYQSIYQSSVITLKYCMLESP